MMIGGAQMGSVCAVLKKLALSLDVCESMTLK